ncbi:hypothetical protein V9T40_005886 [Parthenolecanium corni]|uniref:Small ribosomal subunit protein mS29 n=1 Tax=Parthenolecanium corni TaxID=536013 RepID=A0AAN9YBF0_9HEMI
MKLMRDKTYVPWKSAEVVEDIEETLKTPYQQITPTNPVKRISESNPANHTYQDVGKFYTIPNEDTQHYFQLAGIPKSFNHLVNIFNENALMIRKPALEIIEYMKKASYDKLPIKYVIHGDLGTGKRITRLHVLHYAFLNDFIVLDIPAASLFFKSIRRKDANISETRPPLIDMPLESAVILKNFQLQNGEKIEDLKLKTSKEYVWNLRETTPAGAPLMTLVNHGINRTKYACDCIDVLVDELKIAATAGEIKVLVGIDQFNSFLTGKTKFFVNNAYGVDSRRLSIYQSILRFLEPNWCGGAILATVEEKSALPEDRGSSFPFYLLRREGFELLDPFIPVEVPKLSEMEFHSMLDYYEDRRFLQRLGGREEMEFLTARVARDLRKIVAGL